MHKFTTFAPLATAIGLALSVAAEANVAIPPAGVDGDSAIIASTSGSELDVFLAEKPAALQLYYKALFTEGTRNAVLNNMRIGVAAIEIGEYGRAEQALDDALAQIETIYADDARAKQARSVWSKEAVKDFKGEPYERAMAYYYRGLLYLRAGDYENARASFLQGEYQSTLGEAETYESTFPMMDYLAGWASQCQGNASKAQEFFAAATAGDARLIAPRPQDNVLIVAELGSGPVKFAGGKSKELLQFKAGTPYAEGDLAFAVGSSDAPLSVTTVEAANLAYQATHRGGRAIQAVLDGKVKFKDNLDKVGSVGTTAGMIAMNVGLSGNDLDLAGYGAIAGLAGMAFSMAADRAKPDADIRTWDSLPDSIRVATSHAVAADLSVTTGADLAVHPTQLDDGDGKCSIVWARSNSATQLAASAPGTGLTSSEARKLQRKFGGQDKVFRAALVAQSL